VDLDVEEEEDLKEIQWEADECIVAIKITMKRDERNGKTRSGKRSSSRR